MKKIISTCVAAWSHKSKTTWYFLRLVNQAGTRTHRGVITDFLPMIKEKKHIHATDHVKQTKNWISVEATINAVIQNVNGEKLKPYYKCKKSIAQSVYDVLNYLEWSK